MPDLSAPVRKFGETAATEDWTSLFPALDRLSQDLVGHRLFSCSAFRMRSDEDGVAARIYSSDEANYPTSGLKEIVPNRWTDHVIRGRRVFVANSVAGFEDVFPDHAFIASLGLGSVINLPVILKGAFIGTVNLLHETGYYTDKRLARLDHVTLPALLAFALYSDAPG